MFSDCPGWDFYCSGYSWVTKKGAVRAAQTTRRTWYEAVCFYEGYVG